MSIEQLQLILGALDTLGVKLSEYKHQWTEGEKAIYDQATECLNEEIAEEEAFDKLLQKLPPEMDECDDDEEDSLN